LKSKAKTATKEAEAFARIAKFLKFLNTRLAIRAV
jgi:hypothetical protein